MDRSELLRVDATSSAHAVWRWLVSCVLLHVGHRHGAWYRSVAWVATGGQRGVCRYCPMLVRVVCVCWLWWPGVVFVMQARLSEWPRRIAVVYRDCAALRVARRCRVACRKFWHAPLSRRRALRGRASLG